MLDCIEVVGGKSLKGNVSIQGSKNATLPIMAAALLSEEESVLHNCPKIKDVSVMIELLKETGTKIRWKDKSLHIIPGAHLHTHLASEYAGKMRSSTILLGTLLAREKSSEIPLPGGCVIGKRPIDLHLLLLKKMNVTIEEYNGRLKAYTDKLKGVWFDFPKRSVGATEHGILTAVLADGITVLDNCACEPEVSWLCIFLQKMGARIEGIHTSRLLIYGVEKLHGCDFTIPSDRIAACTYILAGAATRGKITLENPPLEEMHAFLSAYRKMGGQYEVIGGKIVTDSQLINRSIAYIETQEYPGFPTDLQSPLMAVLAGTEGVSRVRENIFEERFKIVSELKKMGADISINGQEAVIKGVQRLKACDVYANELRGAAALMIAALSAKGKSKIYNFSYAERGYESMIEDFNALGACVRRIL